MIQCATIFTDHMLLQRGKPIAVFGTGTPGETVTVSVPERRCTVSGAVDADGSWCVTLPPMPGGTGCTMTVNEQTFTDVAFGEVWLTGGQSNMEFMLKDAKNGAAELAQCADSNVRYFSVPRNTFRDDAYKAAMDAAHWELPSTETSGTWSAAGYLAAKELAQTLGVPVGIIGCNFGGSSVSCWLPEEDLRAAFADCDIFVLPSVANSEAFGIVQQEAMVYGKPVINTALPTGVPHVSLDGVTGITVPPEDADALAQAIQKLADDKALREQYGSAAAKRVAEEYEEKDVVDKVYATLKEVAERRQRT